MSGEKKRGEGRSEKENSNQRSKKSISGKSGYAFFPQLILLVVPLLLYSQTFSFSLSFNDDCIMLIDQAAGLKSFDLHKIFFSDAWMMHKVIELYRPLQSLTYAIDFLFGNSTSIFHMHNVFIFCVDVQLLYLFLKRISIPSVHALWLSLIFSVHFLLVHTVSWIPARGDLYLFAFSIACLLSWQQYFKSKKTSTILFSSIQNSNIKFR